MWWYYSCPMCSNQYKTSNVIKEKEIIIAPTPKKPILESTRTSLTIDDDSGNSVFNFADNVIIYKNSINVHIPETSVDLKDSIFNYLNSNQNKELQLIGWYKNGEINTNSEAQNYGQERANFIKFLLVDFGVNPDKISTSGEIHEYNYNSGEYKGGLELFFKEISETKALEIDKGITNKTLYTKFNSRKFIPDNTLQTYTADLKNYLEKHPSKSVEIIGHTDSLGAEIDNEIIGRDRATNVMNYFISQGIPESKLRSLSKGEMEPIAENTTNSGRSKNRRIEIKVN